MKYRPHLAQMILKGKKTTTWRLFDDKDLTEGEEVEFVNKETLNVFALARLIEVRIKKLKDINEDDYKAGHERYDDYGQMIDTYRDYYGDGVDGDTEVKMIKFELI